MASQNFEQMMNLYHGIFVYCGLAAILFLAIAITLFIFLKIPRVFSELTGRGARKAIQEMEMKRADSGKLLSRKLGEDGRRHRSQKKTGRLRTSRLKTSSEQLLYSGDGGLPEAAVTSEAGYAEEVVPVQTLQEEKREESFPDTEVLSSAYQNNGFIILRSIVEVHTEEVITIEN